VGTSRDSSPVIRACCAFLLLACVGCDELNGGDRRAVGVTESDHLTGSWEASFALDEFGSQPSVAHGVHGTMVFARIKQGGPSFPDMAVPLDYGLYDIDFSSYGFDSRVAGAVPTAIARSWSVSPREPDSLLVVLNPERRGVIVLMRGRLRIDRADGVWTAMSTARSGIGESGRFVMTRSRGAQK
jgi:hypothetical protein